MRSVQAALRRLDAPAQAELDAAPDEVPSAPAERPQRMRRVASPAMAPSAAEAPAAAPAPRLLRRADVVAAPSPSEPMSPPAAPVAALHGVVKWFDLRSRRGALRLQGLSGDVAVEPALLDAMAITRLYKGQEIEATMNAADSSRVERLTIPGGAWQVGTGGGVVRNRQAKPVVVELKREGLRRVAARAEAELVLGPGRDR